MPSSLNGTGVTFNDGTQLNSANDAGGNYIRRTYTSPATWTKPAGLKAVQVTVVGGGGNGGPAFAGISQASVGGGGGSGGASIRYIPAPSIPGPVAVTRGAAGGTSSFGAFASATGGGNGTNRTITTSGTIPPTLQGQPGGAGSGASGDINLSGSRGGFGGGFSNPFAPLTDSGEGGASFISGNARIGAAGQFGGGGAGAVRPGPSPATATGGAGGLGVVIVEEFY